MIENCFVFGYNHANTSEEDRSKVALSESVSETLFAAISKKEVTSLAVLNTCNRTEFYGMGNGNHLMKVYFECTKLDANFKNRFVMLTGNDALQHIFSVAAGLQSQIVGDLEILGQFKNACRQSKANGFMDGYFERLINVCMQAAKEVRSETKITNGTVSLSYAAIKLLQHHSLNNKSTECILIIGAGSFGKNICRDISTFLPAAELVLTNRTEEKAQRVAEHYNCKVLPFTEIKTSCDDFDVVIAAITNEKGDFVVDEKCFMTIKKRIFIDLSLPKVIHPNVAKLPSATLYTIDDAAAIINNSLQQRKEQLPLAQAILKKYIAEFSNWNVLYQKRDSISEWRTELEKSVLYCPVLSTMGADEKQLLIKKGLAEFGQFLKKNPTLPNDTTFVVTHFKKNHATIISTFRNKMVAEASPQV